jgi:hypothetical protein
MLNTDLKGLYNELSDNKTVHLLLLLGSFIVLYIIVSRYLQKRSDNFKNILMLSGAIGNCKNDIPKIDEAIIRNMIELPNRNPAMLTTSMVIPAPTTTDEERRRTRMDILNMFYNSFDDDSVTIGSRPKGLYVIP